MSCEEKVSCYMYKFFLSSNLNILHWHPPSGKKYFTGHLRIPRFSGKNRIGRYRIDLIMANSKMLFLTEFKCKLSESSNDIKKLKEIRDEVGLEKIKSIFINQGANIDSTVINLVLALGVRDIDSNIPNDFVVFQVNGKEKPKVHFGQSFPEKIKHYIEACLQV